MAAMLPASVYGLRVPAGGFPVPGAQKFPASVSLLVLDRAMQESIFEGMETATNSLDDVPFCENCDPGQPANQ